MACMVHCVQCGWLLRTLRALRSALRNSDEVIPLSWLFAPLSTRPAPPLCCCSNTPKVRVRGVDYPALVARTIGVSVALCVRNNMQSLHQIRISYSISIVHVSLDLLSALVSRATPVLDAVRGGPTMHMDQLPPTIDRWRGREVVTIVACWLTRDLVSDQTQIFSSPVSRGLDSPPLSHAASLTVTSPLSLGHLVCLARSPSLHTNISLHLCKVLGHSCHCPFHTRRARLHSISSLRSKPRVARTLERTYCLITVRPACSIPDPRFLPPAPN